MNLETQTHIRINAVQDVPYSRLKSRACGPHFVKQKTEIPFFSPVSPEVFLKQKRSGIQNVLQPAETCAAGHTEKNADTFFMCLRFPDSIPAD
jgi:hypothetical protein